MEYSIISDAISKERLIQKVYKLSAAQNRIRIKWVCRIEDDNDLIIVVRTLSKTFSLSSIVGGNDIPQDVNIFVYSRKKTISHVERDRKQGAYSYYVFPGKLLDTGKIGIYEQKDGKNILKGNPKSKPISTNVQPEGKLYYQYRLIIHAIACICTIAIGWIIHAIVVDLPIQMLARYPRIDYKYFAILIAIGYMIYYVIFPSGNWSKRACLHVVRQSRYTDKAIVRYTVSGCKETFNIRLRDNSDDIVIPLHSGESVSFNNQDILIKNYSYLEYLHWKYFKEKKG